MYARIPVVEIEEFLEQSSFAENLRRAFEAISFAQDGIDNVHFDCRIAAQVGYGARRSNVGEDEVILTPRGSRSLGREVRSPVRAHGRDEAEPLLADYALHVVRQNSHGPAFSDSVVGIILTEAAPAVAVFGGRVAVGSIVQIHPRGTASSSPGFQPDSE